MGDEVTDWSGPDVAVPPRHDSRRMLSIAIAVVLLLVAATGVVVVRRSSACPDPSGDTVSMPAGSAAPADVARAFVAAINAGDRRTAEALTLGSVRAVAWQQATPEVGAGLPFFAHICQIQGFQAADVRPDGDSMSIDGGMVLVVAGDSGLDQDFHRDAEGRLLAGAISVALDPASQSWRVVRITPS